MKNYVVEITNKENKVALFLFAAKNEMEILSQIPLTFARTQSITRVDIKEVILGKGFQYIGQYTSK